MFLAMEIMQSSNISGHRFEVTHFYGLFPAVEILQVVNETVHVKPYMLPASKAELIT